MEAFVLPALKHYILLDDCRKNSGIQSSLSGIQFPSSVQDHPHFEKEVPEVCLITEVP